MDIIQFAARFDSEDACVKHLARIRWPEGPVCDKCGETNRAWKRTEPRSWVCQACKHSFSVTAGTPWHKVKLPLPKVFMAVYLVAVSSKGISSVGLARQISVGQKTAWFLLQRIRQMMDRDKPILHGIVEADETYIGGNGRQRGQMSKRDGTADQPKGRGGSRKMMAVTAVERGGKARARKGMTHSGHVIANALYAWLDREAVLVTDVQGQLDFDRFRNSTFQQRARIEAPETSDRLVQENQ